MKRLAANLVTATDLVAWADRLSSQSVVPRLIRRLVAAAEGVTRVSFRADEGVHLGGWDGIVIRDGPPHPFVPTGPSGWELSVRKDTKAKAGEDYLERTKDSRPLVCAESTLVFVTLRRWAQKSEWEGEKRAEGKWREVRVYDADDIEAWLEATPATHAWLSHQLGKRPDDVWDLETWWDGWSQATRPPVTADLLLAGRDSAVEEIQHGYARPQRRSR